MDLACPLGNQGSCCFRGNIVAESAFHGRVDIVKIRSSKINTVPFNLGKAGIKVNPGNSLYASVRGVIKVKGVAVAVPNAPALGPEGQLVKSIIADFLLSLYSLFPFLLSERGPVRVFLMYNGRQKIFCAGNLLNGNDL